MPACSFTADEASIVSFYLLQDHTEENFLAVKCSTENCQPLNISG